MHSGSTEGGKQQAFQPLVNFDGTVSNELDKAKWKGRVLGIDSDGDSDINPSLEAFTYVILTVDTNPPPHPPRLTANLNNNSPGFPSVLFRARRMVG